MKTIRQTGLLLIGLLLLAVLPAAADDTDIYLKPGAANASPPYLMLMIDYRPSVFSSFCGSLASCVPKMTESSFAKLCSQYAFPTVTSPVLSRANKEAICRKWFQDVDADGVADGQF
ncbi:MAG TPA: hypothetical protein VIN71_09235 [Pseudomonadales bacterium]